jgi:hypothetical protein
MIGGRGVGEIRVGRTATPWLNPVPFETCRFSSSFFIGIAAPLGPAGKRAQLRNCILSQK